MGTERILLSLVILIGFYKAWNIGANDVANSMGTSVASGALTLRQAVVVAGVLNFLGAVLVGAHVTDTVRKGVIDPTVFAHDPNLLIYGMFAAAVGSAICVTTATYLGLPVSTTHALIGALVGFGLLGSGPEGIRWWVVIAIVSSWIISPTAGAFISFLIFTVIRRTILNSESPLEAAKKICPFFIGLVFIILSLALVYKGIHLDLPLGQVLAISIGAGMISTSLGYLLLRRYLPVENGEYDQVENLHKPLQILSACYEAFAHGANDVANAVGPLAAILAIIETQKVAMQVPVPIWILALGGIGLMVGISTWGYRVMETIGRRITEITPTRGFTAEFGAATVVLIFSRLGMPVSTTHTSVGTVIGVGLARGMAALNLQVIRNIIASWLATIPAAAVMTMIIYKILEIFMT